MDDLKKLQGFYMPAEYEEHDGCILIWPTRPGSWPHGGKLAQKAFCQVIKAIAESEKVYLLVDREHFSEAKRMVERELGTEKAEAGNVTLLEMESDDAWARDVGPTFVINETGGRVGINWEFNAWGGSVDGLYSCWDKDDLVASEFCKMLQNEVFDAHPFVLEGGSIHSDGEGTILTTEVCLLSPGRNPHMSKDEIAEMLCATLGAEKIIWLPCGIFNDETNEHVDNICAFVAPGEVVLAWTEDENDPQYAMSRACLKVLEEQTDAKGRRIKVHKLPIPQNPIFVREEDLQGYQFEEGEDVREVGERLAASYVNFYIANDSVIVPQFGDENDEIAVNILTKIFNTRKIVAIGAREILLGGGNIHCITQQIPTRRNKDKKEK